MKMLDDEKDIKRILYHQGFSYVLEIIKIELNSHFNIENLRIYC